MKISLDLQTGYNAVQMSDILQHSSDMPPVQMTWEELLAACARDRGNSPLWSEFVERYGARIRYFIKGALRMAVGEIPATEMESVLGGMQRSDLFQSTILRLVEHDCAAMRSFSGACEYDWLAYLAVISRSVVRESLRRQRAQKRPGGAAAVEAPLEDTGWLARVREGTDPREVDRQLLAQEVRKLGERAIQNVAGETSDRDMLIFRLYFDHDLSFTQIARWQSVKLSKTSVEKTLTRLKDIVRSVVSKESSKEILR